MELEWCHSDSMEFREYCFIYKIAKCCQSTNNTKTIDTHSKITLGKSPPYPQIQPILFSKNFLVRHDFTTVVTFYQMHALGSTVQLGTY
jgi:hypothetical protein